MVRAECVQIITLSFNSNRKFSMNKNICLNTSETAETNEYQLNSLTSIMRISISFSASVFKSDEPDYLLCQFVSTHNEVHFIKLLKKMNHHTITILNFYQSVQMAAMYKQKINKVQSMNSFKSNERASESDSGW